MNKYHACWVLLLFMIGFISCARIPAVISPQADLKKMEFDTLPALNLYQDVYFGPPPLEDSDFNELATFGVRTIINIDRPESLPQDPFAIENVGASYVLFTLEQQSRDNFQDLRALLQKKRKEGRIYLFSMDFLKLAQWLALELSEEKNLGTTAIIQNIKKIYTIGREEESTIEGLLSSSRKKSN